MGIVRHQSFSFSPSQSSYKDSLCHCATCPSSACRDKQQAADSHPFIFVLITGSKRNRSVATTGKMDFPQTFSDSSQVNLPCSPHSKPCLLRVSHFYRTSIPTSEFQHYNYEVCKDNRRRGRKLCPTLTRKQNAGL